jgi:heat shock factor-binding protein 1
MSEGTSPSDMQQASLSDPKSVHELTNFIQITLQQMQDKFQLMSDQIINRIDDMGNRIDDLEKNIADLINQSGNDDPQQPR